MKRKLTGKGIEFIEDEHGIGTRYLNGTRMLREQIDNLTMEQVSEATSPKTPEEREEYYKDKQAEYEMEEAMIRDAEPDEDDVEYEPDDDLPF